MTRTLEALWAELGGTDEPSDEYDLRRSLKIAEIADYIRPFLRNPNFAEGIAEQLMERAEEMGRIQGDTITGEVRATLTRSGNPLPFEI